MIFAFLNQKGGVARPRSPRTSPANWRCAACMSSCWMPTRRGHRSTGRSGVASRACPVCSAPWALPAKRCIRKRQNSPGGPITSSSTARRASPPSRVRAAGGRARADPRAAQPLRRMGFCRDGRTDPRSTGVPASCARPSSSTGASAPPSSAGRHGNRWPNSRRPRCAGDPPAHRLCRQRSRWPARPRNRARQRRCPRDRRAHRRTAAVADMTGKPPPRSKRVGIGARPQRIRTPKRGFARATQMPCRKATSTPLD